MTDEQFDAYFKSLSVDEKYQWLRENIRTVIVQNGECYGLNDTADLDKMIEQEMYQNMTGRE